MKQYIILIIVLSIFLSSVNAAEITPPTEYCEPSLQRFDEYDRMALNIIGTDELDCECFGGDIVNAGEWRNAYCNDNELGQMSQTRTEIIKIKPNCVETITIINTRVIDDERCKICPPPERVTAPKHEKCVNGQELLKRNVVAYVYTPLVEECELRNYVEFELVDSTMCSAPFGNSIIKLKEYWLVFVVVAFASLAFFAYKWYTR